MHKTYKLFKFTDIFEYERGKRFTKQEQIPGEIAYISSTKNNNGIDNYVTPPEKNLKGSEIKIYNNCITLSNSGSVGYLFYHDYDFIASDHVTVIWLKDNKIKLNKYIALYLKPVFESIKYKYNFGREIKNPNLENEYIKLPVDQNKNPNWKFMENYMKSIEEKISFQRIKTVNKKNEKLKIDTSTWHEFLLTEIFQKIESGKCNNASMLPAGNDCSYLGAKKKDACFMRTVGANKELVSEGNCIALICDGDGSVGYSNYINSKEVIATVNLALAYSKNINKYNALFLVSILDMERYKYSFGRKYKTRIQKTKIKLPAVLNKNGEFEPNWEFMEDYIKSLPYADLL